MLLKRLTSGLAAVMVLLGGIGAVTADEAPLSSCATVAALQDLRTSASLPVTPRGDLNPRAVREELTPGGHFLLRFAGSASPVPPAAVEEVSRTLDAAWRILVGSGAWPDPAAEGPLEVTLLRGAAHGPSRTLPLAIPGTGPEEGVPVTLVITGSPLDWPLAALHQFLHAVQMTATMREGLWAYESTALALEDRLLGGGMLDPVLLDEMQDRSRNSLAGATPRQAASAAPFLTWLSGTRGAGALSRWWRRAARKSFL